MRTSSNPALTRSPAFVGAPGDRSVNPVEQAYFGPTATARDTGRMTVEDVVIRTGLLLGVLVITGALTWVLKLEALALPAALIGLGLGLFISFKQVTNPVAIVAYAALEGIFLGGVSALFEQRYPGVVVQAVVGTGAVTAVVLALYRSGRIRVTPQFQKIVIAATLGFLGLLLVNLIASVFVSGGLGLRSGGPLGIIISLFAIGLAAMNLVLDFDLVAKGAARGLPERYGWFAAFALLVTLVWLYVELLRLLGALRR
ncbi:MAG TPA: Bax inhibitor-1/YccA family protein [Mycobacteriales bacterium]|nr:Bax inhibitor-1/YccA family protein [Mycobacteriales bacterium]